jgi:GNAT superfamily N-acetyltransferase
VREIRLFTGAGSAANLRLYTRHGYRETHREPVGTLELVHLAKPLPPRAATRFRVRRDGPVPNDVEHLLAALPDWFGIDEANRSYVADAARLPTWTARTADGEVVGVLLLARHFPESAEVHLLAVAPDRHRHGIGRALVDAAAADSRAAGARLLTVKTLGPSHPDQWYATTRTFYTAVGFLPVEELAELWPGNPCLIMVRPL